MKQQNILLLGDQKDTHCIYQAAQEINTCLMTTTQCDNIIDKIDEYDIKLFLILTNYKYIILFIKSIIYIIY